MTEDTVVRVGAKKRDYWWTVLFTDPLAVPAVRFLAKRRWLSPDQVSVAAALLGVAVGPLFALGSRWALVSGGLVFYTAFLVDCIDGKLARATGVTSARGAALDALGDAARRASASFGLAVGIIRSEGASAELWWAVAYFAMAYLFIELSGGSEVRQVAWGRRSEGEAARGRSTRWADALAKWRLLPTPGMPDVQAVAFILGPISGYVVAGLAVGIAMLAGGIGINLWRLLK